MFVNDTIAKIDSEYMSYILDINITRPHHQAITTNNLYNYII